LIEIYPNLIEAGEVIHVKVPEGNGRLNLIIFSMKGTIVLEQIISTVNGVTDIYTNSSMASGTYFVHIYNEEKQMLCSKKIIIK
jgi:hypothetical protein